MVYDHVVYGQYPLSVGCYLRDPRYGAEAVLRLIEIIAKAQRAYAHCNFNARTGIHL